MIDAFKRSSAGRITAVMPYYCYSRQDWKDRPRVPISARLVADLLETAGADRILTMDLHSAQIQGFFSIPVDNLMAAPVLANHIKTLKLEDLTVVSPDAGGVGRAKHFAKKLGAKLAIIDKRRPRPNVAEVLHVIGEVAGPERASSSTTSSTPPGPCPGRRGPWSSAGAKGIFSACTHPVLSGPALDRIGASNLERIFVTNTIPLTEKAAGSARYSVLSVAELFGEAIRRINEGSSVSSLFA